MGFLLLMMVVGLLLGLLSQSARWGMIGWEMFFLSLLFPVLYSLLICADSTGENHSLRVGMLSVLASFVQLIGYGTGFLRAWWLRCVCGRTQHQPAAH